jgi:regulator of protease activity HflC (stomatin/prohibitin superfamily)
MHFVPDTMKLKMPSEGKISRRQLIWGQAAAVILLGAAIFPLRDRIFITVPPGEVLVVYHRFSGGTVSNTIGREGMNVILPWDIPYRYTIRAQTLILPMTVLSRDGLEVNVDAVIRFRLYPKMVPYLHRRYGPDYVKTVVTPELTESVQAVVGQFHAEDFYSFKRDATLGRIFQTARRIIGGVYVYVEEISIINVRLPERVQSAIQAKAEADQDAQKQAFLVKREVHESERKRMEAIGLEHFRDNVTRIPSDVLKWKSIEATTDLSKSRNSKVVVLK